MSELSLEQVKIAALQREISVLKTKHGSTEALLRKRSAELLKALEASQYLTKALSFERSNVLNLERGRVDRRDEILRVVLTRLTMFEHHTSIKILMEKINEELQS